MTDDTQNPPTIERQANDGASERYFLSLTKEEVLRKLTLIAMTLNIEIDKGAYSDITTERIRTELNGGTIFNFLGEFPPIKSLALGDQDAEVREWLLAEWQSTDGCIDPVVTRSGLCLLLAWVLEGIQMRTFEENPWPAAEP